MSIIQFLLKMLTKQDFFANVDSLMLFQIFKNFILCTYNSQEGKENNKPKLLFLIILGIVQRLSEMVEYEYNDIEISDFCNEITTYK